VIRKIGLWLAFTIPWAMAEEKEVSIEKKTLKISVPLEITIKGVQNPLKNLFDEYNNVQILENKNLTNFNQEKLELQPLNLPLKVQVEAIIQGKIRFDLEKEDSEKLSFLNVKIEFLSASEKNPKAYEVSFILKIDENEQEFRENLEKNLDEYIKNYNANKASKQEAYKLACFKIQKDVEVLMQDIKEKLRKKYRSAGALYKDENEEHSKSISIVQKGSPSVMEEVNHVSFNKSVKETEENIFMEEYIGYTKYIEEHFQLGFVKFRCSVLPSIQFEKKNFFISSSLKLDLPKKMSDRLKSGLEKWWSFLCEPEPELDYNTQVLPSPTKSIIVPPKEVIIKELRNQKEHFMDKVELIESEMLKSIQNVVLSELKEWIKNQ